MVAGLETESTNNEGKMVLKSEVEYKLSYKDKYSHQMHEEKDVLTSERGSILWVGPHIALTMLSLRMEIKHHSKTGRIAKLSKLGPEILPLVVS